MIKVLYNISGNQKILAETQALGRWSQQLGDVQEVTGTFPTF